MNFSGNFQILIFVKLISWLKFNIKIKDFLTILSPIENSFTKDNLEAVFHLLDTKT